VHGDNDVTRPEARTTRTVTGVTPSASCEPTTSSAAFAAANRPIATSSPSARGGGRRAERRARRCRPAGATRAWETTRARGEANERAAARTRRGSPPEDARGAADARASETTHAIREGRGREWRGRRRGDGDWTSDKLARTNHVVTTTVDHVRHLLRIFDWRDFCHLSPPKP
jgi:hypothetical protein